MEIHARATHRFAFGREAVFDFTTRVDGPALLFRGWGPIPGTRSSETLDGATRLTVGCIRRITAGDGTVIDEEITALERPTLQRYRLPPGSFPGIFGVLVREARGEWLYHAESEGSRVDWTFTFVLRSPAAWPLAAPLVAAFARAMRDALRRVEPTMRELHL